MRLDFCIFLFGCFMTTSWTGTAGSAEPIRYVLRFPAPQTHYVEVEARRPGRRVAAGRADDGGLDARLVPGARVCAATSRRSRPGSPDGKPLALAKVRKNRWRVADRGGRRGDRLLPGLLPRTMSVQGNWVDSSFALLNGAATFLTLAGSVPRDRTRSRWCCRRRVEDQRHGAARRRGPSAAPLRRGRFRHPGRFADLRGQPGDLRVPGRRHAALPRQRGRGGPLGRPASARDVEAIVRAQKAFWGSLPYEKYVFFNLLTESGGGLEHKNSTVLMASRWATRTRSSYLVVAQPREPRVSSTPGT